MVGLLVDKFYMHLIVFLKPMSSGLALDGIKFQNRDETTPDKKALHITVQTPECAPPHGAGVQRAPFPWAEENAQRTHCWPAEAGLYVGLKSWWDLEVQKGRCTEGEWQFEIVRRSSWMGDWDGAGDDKVGDGLVRLCKVDDSKRRLFRKRMQHEQETYLSFRIPDARRVLDLNVVRKLYDLN